jgi:hypothetical protein
MYINTISTTDISAASIVQRNCANSNKEASYPPPPPAPYLFPLQHPLLNSVQKPRRNAWGTAPTNETSRRRETHHSAVALHSTITRTRQAQTNTFGEIGPLASRISLSYDESSAMLAVSMTTAPVFSSTTTSTCLIAGLCGMCGSGAIGRDLLVVRLHAFQRLTSNQEASSR